MLNNIYSIKKIKFILFAFFFLMGIIIFLLIPNDNHLSQSYAEHKINFFQPSNPTHFPFPETLKPQLEFWKKVFTEYTSKQAVIHDRRHVGIIYTVIDLTEKQIYSERARKKEIRSVINKYKHILLKLNKLDPRNIDKLSKEEKKVFHMFNEIPGKYTFTRARRNFRVQYGLRDHFRKSMVHSTRYIKEMERIFTEYGLPVELTRLPFIESSFNLEAHSLSGAVGIWQFTRSTGKAYMKINSFIDERKNPLKSTEAAAKLLSSYYSQLKSWPLAITAFNHGAYAMKRAIKETKSRDIETIIDKYKSRSFGFASRNFYVEFLAILEILKNYRHYFGEIEFLSPERYEEFILGDCIKMNTLLKYCSLDKQVITRLNPELNKSVLTSRSYLPDQYHLKIPVGMKEKIKKEYARIASTEKRSIINVTKLHRVRYGQNLSHIARLYKTSVKAIISANSIKNPNRIIKGQVLRIPTQT
jgi:membrane-bound lytic murein transglycosylase D